jgi:hydroxyacylglutathione hydrolase
LRLKLKRIINEPIHSNSYIIWQIGQKSSIIIDPGSFHNKGIKSFLKLKQLKAEYIILTHEHFDHCAGVNDLIGFTGCNLVCSRITAVGIKNSKNNLSRYFEEIDEFQILYDPQIVKDGETLTLCNIQFQFYETPGHSPGSTCIKVGKNLFSGDTLLDKTASPLKLPGGNKDEYKKSISQIKSILSSDEFTVKPGHGNSFRYSKIEYDNITHK